MHAQNAAEMLPARDAYQAGWKYDGRPWGADHGYGRETALRTLAGGGVCLKAAGACSSVTLDGREQAPRKNGITIVIDKGLGIASI